MFSKTFVDSGREITADGSKRENAGEMVHGRCAKAKTKGKGPRHRRAKAKTNRNTRGMPAAGGHKDENNRAFRKRKCKRAENQFPTSAFFSS